VQIKNTCREFHPRLIRRREAYGAIGCSFGVFGGSSRSAVGFTGAAADDNMQQDRFASVRNSALSVVERDTATRPD